MARSYWKAIAAFLLANPTFTYSAAMDRWFGRLRNLIHGLYFQESSWMTTILWQLSRSTGNFVTWTWKLGKSWVVPALNKSLRGGILTNIQPPPLGFVFIFLLFSFLFLSNTYKLWFNTDKYYEDIYNSLTRTPVPFKDFFLKRVANRKRWEMEQKIFSIIGFVTVIGADVLVLMAYFG